MDLYLGYPIFLWEGAITLASTLLAGLLIAFVTTFYLKKKDERTRVAGVILEKRVDAQQEILQFMESNTQKVEMRQPQSAMLREVILSHGMTLPYEPHIQYADIFSSVEKFRVFFKNMEKMLEKYKLWLDLKVRHHVLLMQTYFSMINSMLVLFNRVPLPEGVELSEDDFTKLGDQLLLMLGAVLDEEFNHLVMDLEVLMVGSIYKLDLSRPKHGLYAQKQAGKEKKRVEFFLYEEALLGEYIRIMPVLTVQLLQAYKGIDISLEEAMDYYMGVARTSVTDKARSFVWAGWWVMQSIK